MVFDYISSKNALPFEQRVAQNFSGELEWSPNFIIGIVFSGSLTIQYEMHQREFSLHDIFFFLPMQSFSFISSSKNARVLLFSIDVDYLSQLCPQITSLRLSQNHISANLSNSLYYDLCKDFSTIIFNNLKAELCTRMQLLTSITHMANLILENYGIIDEEKAKTAAGDDRRPLILNYIKEHYKESLSATAIAKEFGLHPQYFSTYFHKQFGTNFVEYLTNYRISRSLYDLIYTDESILNISLNHGFSSHKTYSAAFKKIYDMRPMEYRRNMRNQNNKTPEFSPDTEKESSGGMELFSYFRQFLDADHMQNQAPQSAQSKFQQNIELDPAALQKGENIYQGLKMISCGRAYMVLRSEVQSQIRQAKAELGIKYLRIRDIFSDDLYVYFEDEKHNPIYSWQSLDMVFDFIKSIDLIPFVEIGYMPELLAAKKQYGGVIYHPNVSMPKDYKLWAALIQEFLNHYIDRYGLHEVKRWLFCFWTSPDLDMKNAYWNESQDEFFKFYKITYQAIKSVDKELALGSANFSTITGFPWYEAFFEYCFANRLYPDFVDFHVYGVEPSGPRVSHDSFLQIQHDDFSIINQDNIHNNLQTMHQIMNRTGFRSLDVISSDWNLSFLPKDYIRDTCYMGPYLCHTYIRNLNLSKALCFWSLSDIHDDAFPESRLFTGGPGLLDYHGIRKASYNTLMLLNCLGDHILKVGDNYIFTRSNNRYQLLIYNLASFDPMFRYIDHSAMDESHRYQIYSGDNLYINLILHLPDGTYYIKKSEVNRSCGSSYDLWNEMGAPAVLHKEMEDYIRDTAKPKISYRLQNVKEALLLTEEVPVHGIILLEIIQR